ncbi:ABC transporter substrate-binding protein [Chelativorans sp. YIM 93263]|uniref:ABC transporter substrate-binding protein n=1 Tax=Chelativorans sp. YIM 93263 TaxID=2906648 RepID=UPI002377D5E2|nr:ABC transporter substrate-binding protein [Chelativorans sp. YIM 93263]
MRIIAAILFFLLAVVPAAAETVTFGFLSLEGDPRYSESRLDMRLPAQPWGKPDQGAEVALRESRFVGSALGVEFDLESVVVAEPKEAASALDAFIEQEISFVLLDLPGELVAQLAQATAGRDVMLFNISAPDDALRQTACSENLLNIGPSRAMLSDALAQYLVRQDWRDVMVLKGEAPEDEAVFAAFERSAKRYGLNITEVRPFVLGSDPRERQRNNVALLTSDAEYDVLFIAEASGEFAREVPFRTQHPRPAVGAAGLTPNFWHWAWERHGAAQLNNRFERQAERFMTGYDWAAWIATKAVVEAVVRTETTEFGAVADYVRSEEIVLDGFKGYPLNFRPWNNQLRQPVFLTMPNWVVDRAPFEGFLHETNNLDTLGFDERETQCALSR